MPHASINQLKIFLLITPYAFPQTLAASYFTRSIPDHIVLLRAQVTHLGRRGSRRVPQGLWGRTCTSLLTMLYTERDGRPQFLNAHKFGQHGIGTQLVGIDAR